MNPLEMRVIDIQADQLEAVLGGLLPAEWPVSGDDIARRREGVKNEILLG